MSDIKRKVDEFTHDPRQILLAAANGQGTGRGPHTSDLTIDEVLVIHSVGYETLEFVTGNAVVAIPQGSWTFASGEINEASLAHHRAFELATDRLLEECREAGGQGVVGVTINVRLRSHGVSVELAGTAVVKNGGSRASGPSFASDLSGQDFSLLIRAGWQPLGLAVGASYVHIPRVGVGQFMNRVGQNVEMTQMTEALYAAREAAMERMQQAAIDLGGQGVVAVHVDEGMMNAAASRVAVFRAYGTVVTLAADTHQMLNPQMAVPLDDPTEAFDAANLT